jgi:hypothetical protein
MLVTKNDVVFQLVNRLKKQIDDKKYGEIGISILVHDGSPVKIIETTTTNIIKRENGMLEITK